MQPTTVGSNVTGGATHAPGVKHMLDAVEELSPPMPIDASLAEAERLRYAADADSVGSIPPPASLLKGAARKGKAAVRGISPNLLMDKIGERLAFERTGTRLYDALITKYLALAEADGDEVAALSGLDGETPLETLRRIRQEEHAHFLMLSEVVTELGGDPTAQTPCADVAATASMGVLQVITDPRTTLAQCLDAALIAELTDNASWEMLAELADKSGNGHLSARFLHALESEQQHLLVVKSWLRSLNARAAGTPAV
jgi:rubrerythrin